MTETLESGVMEAVQGLGENFSHRGSAQNRIRILYIIDQLTEMGGAERLLIKTIRSLPPERFRCSLVTFKLDDSLPLFSSLPCDVRVIPLRKSYDLRALRASMELRRLIRTQKIDVVHTFFETADLWGGLTAHFSGCPVLLSSRRDMGILRSRKHVLAYRMINPLFTKVIAVSDEVRRYCVEIDHIRPNNVQTVYNGVELRPPCLEDRSIIRERLGIGGFREIVLTIGNIRKIKGIDILLRAAAQTCKMRPSTLLLIVGDNHEPAHFSELEELVVELGISKNVRFYGPSEDVASLLASADVFCLPSRSEGFSNALIEAMAAGIPCIASRVGGNAEAIEDGSDGVLVPSEDPTSLSSAISGLLNDPIRAQALGKRAINTVRARFTHAAMMTQMTGIYETLVAKAGR